MHVDRGRTGGEAFSRRFGEFAGGHRQRRMVGLGAPRAVWCDHDQQRAQLYLRIDLSSRQGRCSVLLSNRTGRMRIA
jgi:hypothetical protein